MQHTTEQTKQYQCRHIFTDGHRCASPCLRKEEFCYYHHTTRRPVANPTQRRTRRSTFHLPLPEDRSAIQASIGEVLQRIAANQIDPRRAGLLLYGLQIASLNLPKMQTATKPGAELQTVEEITTDPDLGIIAPRTEVSAATERKSTVAKLIERIMQNEPPAHAESIMQNEPSVRPLEPATIPTLQATADLHNHALTHKEGVTPTEPRAQSRGQWGDPRISHLPLLALGGRNAVEKSASPPLSVPTVNRGSCTPCPPAHHAYTRSWRSPPASGHRRESHIRGPQSPCSWSQ
jgi:hypothetical protein